MSTYLPKSTSFVPAGTDLGVKLFVWCTIDMFMSIKLFKSRINWLILVQRLWLKKFYWVFVMSIKSNYSNQEEFDSFIEQFLLRSWLNNRSIGLLRMSIKLFKSWIIWFILVLIHKDILWLACLNNHINRIIAVTVFLVMHFNVCFMYKSDKPKEGRNLILECP